MTRFETDRFVVRGFAQLALFLGGLSLRTAKRLVDDGLIPRGRVLRGSRYWLVEELRDALRSQPRELAHANPGQADSPEAELSNQTTGDSIVTTSAARGGSPAGRSRICSSNWAPETPSIMQ